MKLWIDEDLSPALVEAANSRGLDHIERQTTQSGATDSGEFMINRVVEVDEKGVCTDFPLPN